MRLEHNRLYVNVLKMLISVNRGAEEPLPRPDGYATRRNQIRCAYWMGCAARRNLGKSD